MASLRVLTRAVLRRRGAMNVRTLYSPQMLGIDKFVEECETFKKRWLGDTEKLFAERASMIEREETLAKNDYTSGHIVLHEDLKLLLKLSESEDHINLCLRMLKRHRIQNQSLRFANFVFGPVVVRKLHVLDKPDIIIEIFRDPQLKGLFDQYVSYHIAMDLLYKHQRYQEVLEFYEMLRALQLQGSSSPRDCVVLMLGSCYHLGTQESLEKALSLIKNARRSGALVLRKGLTFAAALALKLEKPQVALEILAMTAQMNNATVCNLRFLALSQCDRHEEVFQELRSIVHNHHYMRQGHSEVCAETLERICEHLEKKGLSEKVQALTQLERGLKEGRHISKLSLEELLNLPMVDESPDHNRPTMFKGTQQFRPKSSARSSAREE